MAKINVSEKDFDAVADAARAARDKGNRAQAAHLDKIARKINAGLTNAAYGKNAKWLPGYRAISWQEVPSVLDTPPAARRA